ncbi:MAG: hypothetical protein ABIU05_24745 [Nitrospirales bacterium]
MVTKTTLKEYRAEQAELRMSTEDRLKRVTGSNERLNTHAWTDAQLLAIPEELVQFAYEHSEALRQEFSSFETFQAYIRTMKRGAARIAGRR